jgi:hypothetical protein
MNTKICGYWDYDVHVKVVSELQANCNWPPDGSGWIASSSDRLPFWKSLRAVCVGHRTFLGTVNKWRVLYPYRDRPRFHGCPVCSIFTALTETSQLSYKDSSVNVVTLPHFNIYRLPLSDGYASYMITVESFPRILSGNCLF